LSGTGEYTGGFFCPENILKRKEKEFQSMKKVFEVTKMALAIVKAFLEYQISHRKPSDQL
jgi:hypothetical protein